MSKEVVLCVSNAYQKKYYLNFIFPIDIPEPWSLKDVHPLSLIHI